MSMTKIILIDKQTHGTFWSQVQFLFFSDRHTLKFLKVKCNQIHQKSRAKYFQTFLIIQWSDGAQASRDLQD